MAISLTYVRHPGRYPNLKHCRNQQPAVGRKRRTKGKARSGQSRPGLQAPWGDSVLAMTDLPAWGGQGGHPGPSSWGRAARPQDAALHIAVHEGKRAPSPHFPASQTPPLTC